MLEWGVGGWAAVGRGAQTLLDKPECEAGVGPVHSCGDVAPSLDEVWVQ